MALEKWTYEDACRQAATDQGLDPVVAALAEAGLAARVEQTGGFCMVVTTQTMTRTYAVVRDGTDPERPYLLGVYTNDGWRNCGETLIDRGDLTLAEVVDYVTRARARGERRARS